MKTEKETSGESNLYIEEHISFLRTAEMMIISTRNQELIQSVKQITQVWNPRQHNITY